MALIGIALLLFLNTVIQDSLTMRNNISFGIIFFLVGVVVYLIYVVLTRVQRAGDRVTMNAKNIDYMSGSEFEIFLNDLLIANGFKSKIVGGSGDNGIDLVAEKDGARYSIQAKRYKGKVNRRAITDAVAGQHAYGCQKAMVITNSYFTLGAKDFAKACNCILIDRDRLGAIIRKTEQSCIS